MTPHALAKTTLRSTGMTVYIRVDTTGRYFSLAFMIGRKSYIITSVFHLLGGSRPRTQRTRTKRTSSHTRPKPSPFRKLIKTTKSTIFIAPASVWSKKNFITKLWSPECRAGAHFSLSFWTGNVPLSLDVPRMEGKNERSHPNENSDFSDRERHRLEISAREGNPGYRASRARCQ